jgi:tape measure domain-containing protein
LPNKTLTAKVKLNTKQFETQIKNLTTKLNAVDRALNNSSRLTSGITNSTNGWSKSIDGVNTKLKKTNSLFGSLKTKILGSLLSLQTFKLALQGADTLTGATNQFNNISTQKFGDSAYTKDANGNVVGYSQKTKDFTQETLDKIYNSAKESRMLYSNMMSNVAKTMTLAPDAFKGNIDNAIKFQEVMAKSYAVSGASAAEMETSMYQLTQALGAGVLAGDELRSVREGAPLAYQKIEEFAQGVLKTSESLKDLAADGKITSEIVVAAVMNMENEIDTAFSISKYRFKDFFTQIRTEAERAFSPAVKMLSDMLTKAVDNGAIDKIANIFVVLSKAIMITLQGIDLLFTGIINAINFITPKIEFLGKLIITGLVVALALMLGYLILNLMTGYKLFWMLIKGFILTKLEAIKAAIASATSWLTLCWPLTLIIAILAAVVIAVIWVADSFEDACGMIVGGIMAAVAFIWNLFVGIVNQTIQLLWTWFVQPFINIIEWVLNAANDGFTSFGGAVANLIGNIIGWFLSLGQVVTTIIDAIFGTNWTSGLESLKSTVTSWGKKEDASITISREAPKLERWAYSDAYSTGYDWGYAGGEKISNAVSSLSLDNIGSSLGLDLSGVGVDPTATLDPDSTEALLGNISDNTDNISDSLDLTTDDLKYLRDVANMEWKREYTTASITVDMSNYNTVNGDSDLDGIVTKLADKLYEEMDYLANGVYA